jgi:hypothetical protein
MDNPAFSTSGESQSIKNDVGDGVEKAPLASEEQYDSEASADPVTFIAANKGANRVDDPVRHHDEPAMPDAGKAVSAGDNEGPLNHESVNESVDGVNDEALLEETSGKHGTEKDGDVAPSKVNRPKLRPLVIPVARKTSLQNGFEDVPIDDPPAETAVEVCFFFFFIFIFSKFISNEASKILKTCLRLASQSNSLSM